MRYLPKKSNDAIQERELIITEREKRLVASAEAIKKIK